MTITNQCLLCDASANKVTAWKKPYSILQCTGCKLLFCDPIPTDEELYNFYQGFLYRKPNLSEIEKKIVAKQTEINKLFCPEVSSPQQGKTFLDHGGGTGVAYAAAKRLGYEVSFYEVDDQANDFVKQNFGLEEDRLYRTEQELIDSEHTYDCILSDNVIEHVQDPVDYLRKVYDLLAPGGRLIVKTPHASNRETWFYPMISILSYCKLAWKYDGLPAAWRVLTKRIWHCDPPRHIYSFTGKSMMQAAQKAGISSSESNIEWYRLPLWEYSFTRACFKKIPTKKKLLVRLIVILCLPIEWCLKLFQVIATKFGLISAAGLKLVVDKSEAGE